MEPEPVTTPLDLYQYVLPEMWRMTWVIMVKWPVA
jgi:hypothetical protein